MRWSPGSGGEQDVEDRRGSSIGRGAAGIGIGGLLLLGALSLLTGRNFLQLAPLLEQVTPPAPTNSGPVQSTPKEDERKQFVTFVINDTQDTWQQVLGSRYQRTKLVLFRNAVESGCGVAQSAMGPFYCPADHKVYIDLGFYDELQQRFGAAGDFAQAYVIAHEVGHHVQNLLGIDEQVRRLQQARPQQANALSVRLELQADCLAGIWGHSTAQRNILEQGDVEEGLNAAAAIGDDRIQGKSGRGVHPEGFTHGSSAQRVEWFKRGLQSGDINRCDTFSAGS